MNHPLQWKKYPVLNDGFICLVDVMGDDSSIVQAARVSYGKDEREPKNIKEAVEKSDKDRQLIRYLLNHSHTTPFEMVEFKFLVRVPMDCWRQWIRHRTANVNEYSTRYTEAIDSQQTTSPEEWRLQATDNKQGSSGFLEGEIGELISAEDFNLLVLDTNEYQFGSRTDAGHLLSTEESLYHKIAKNLYNLRLKFGVAKEQARKDLPLSTYTEAYWKCDLHNIFNFLRLRMDSHAQLEIRSYANAMAEIVKQVVPVAWEAFEDYVLYAKKFSRMEMNMIRNALKDYFIYDSDDKIIDTPFGTKPNSMTDREWKEFLNKLA